MKIPLSLKILFLIKYPERFIFPHILVVIFVFAGCIRNSDEFKDEISEFKTEQIRDLNTVPIPLSKINELKKGDIIIKPNSNLIPGSCQVYGGADFGHAAIVVKGSHDDDILQLLSRTLIFESQARDMEAEYQLRLVNAYSENIDPHLKNNSFDLFQTGYRYRLRPKLKEAETDSLISWILAKDPGISSWHAIKKFNPNGKNEKKPENQHWYCSLLIWQAFHDVLGIDLDPNGGFYVFPNDLICSPYFNNTDSASDCRVRF
jgi:hypothetical protein